MPRVFELSELEVSWQRHLFYSIHLISLTSLVRRVPGPEVDPVRRSRGRRLDREHELCDGRQQGADAHQLGADRAARSGEAFGGK